MYCLYIVAIKSDITNVFASCKEKECIVKNAVKIQNKEFVENLVRPCLILFLHWLTKNMED